MDQEKESEEAKKTTFIEKADALIDEWFQKAEAIKDPKYAPGLKPWDHKLWIALMQLQIEDVNNNLVDKYTSKIDEFYKPIMAGFKQIDKIALELPKIKEQLTRIQLRQTNEDRRLNEHDIALELNRQAIKKAEDKILKIEKTTNPDLIKEFFDKIEKVTPKLDLIIEINQPKTIRRRIFKAVSIAVLIGALLLLFAFYIHNSLFHNSNKVIPKTEVPKDKSTIPEK